MSYTATHLAAAALGLAVYLVANHRGKLRRAPSAAIAWVLSMIAFPYAALPVFLLFGTRRFARPPVAGVAGTGAAPQLAPAWASRVSAGLFLPPARRNARIALFDDGAEALDALVGVIDGARHCLDLCVFVFADDATGRRVAEALARCARRGCRVRVLLDGVGGLRMSRALRRWLVRAGVDLRWFLPLVHDPRRGQGNSRNHRKLAIADAACLWSGGRNLADEYFLERPGQPAWVDLSFVVEGALVADAVRTFEQDWHVAGGDAGVPFARDGAGFDAMSDAVAQLIPSGPDQALDTLHPFLVTAIYQAQARILAATPYFVPDEALLQALVVARRRGVRVCLLMPERSNHRLADLARGRDLRDLAAAGAEIRLLPGMLHAKLVVVDEAVALCGSANLDGRSLFLNRELSTAFYRAREVEAFADWYQRAARPAREYVPVPPTLARDALEGLVRAVGFQL
jgi:cardiolipin synthase